MSSWPVPVFFDWPQQAILLINVAGLLDTDGERLQVIQLEGTCTLFALAEQHGARVLQISALGAGDWPGVPFLASKAEADGYLLQYCHKGVVVRPSVVVGGGGASSRVLASLPRLLMIPLLDCHSRLQPSHVDDLVRTIMALLERWPQQPCVLAVVGSPDSDHG